MDLNNEQKEALALDLAHQVLRLVAGNSHQVVLTALINAFVVVATQHTCCTRDAANSAQLASDVLNKKAAPYGQPIH